MADQPNNSGELRIKVEDINLEKGDVITLLNKLLETDSTVARDFADRIVPFLTHQIRNNITVDPINIGMKKTADIVSSKLAEGVDKQLDVLDDSLKGFLKASKLVQSGVVAAQSKLVTNINRAIQERFKVSDLTFKAERVPGDIGSTDPRRAGFSVVDFLGLSRKDVKIAQGKYQVIASALLSKIDRAARTANIDLGVLGSSAGIARATSPSEGQKSRSWRTLQEEAPEVTVGGFSRDAVKQLSSAMGRGKAGGPSDGDWEKLLKKQRDLYKEGGFWNSVWSIFKDIVWGPAALTMAGHPILGLATGAASAGLLYGGARAAKAGLLTAGRAIGRGIGRGGPVLDLRHSNIQLMAMRQWLISMGMSPADVDRKMASSEFNVLDPFSRTGTKQITASETAVASRGRPSNIIDVMESLSAPKTAQTEEELLRKFVLGERRKEPVWWKGIKSLIDEHKIGLPFGAEETSADVALAYREQLLGQFNKGREILAKSQSPILSRVTLKWMQSTAQKIGVLEDTFNLPKAALSWKELALKDTMPVFVTEGQNVPRTLEAAIKLRKETRAGEWLTRVIPKILTETQTLMTGPEIAETAGVERREQALRLGRAAAGGPSPAIEAAEAATEGIRPFTQTIPITEGLLKTIRGMSPQERAAEVMHLHYLASSAKDSKEAEDLYKILHTFTTAKNIIDGKEARRAGGKLNMLGGGAVEDILKRLGGVFSRSYTGTGFRVGGKWLTSGPWDKGQLGTRLLRSPIFKGAKGWQFSWMNEGAKPTTTMLGKGGKFAFKWLPMIGTAISLGMAAKRGGEGDQVGAMLDTVSGIANLFPGLGSLISAGIDLGIQLPRDLMYQNDPRKKESIKRWWKSIGNYWTTGFTKSGRDKFNALQAEMDRETFKEQGVAYESDPTVKTRLQSSIEALKKNYSWIEARKISKEITAARASLMLTDGDAAGLLRRLSNVYRHEKGEGTPRLNKESVGATPEEQIRVPQTAFTMGAPLYGDVIWRAGQEPIRVNELDNIIGVKDKTLFNKLASLVEGKSGISNTNDQLVTVIRHQSTVFDKLGEIIRNLDSQQVQPRAQQPYSAQPLPGITSSAGDSRDPAYILRGRVWDRLRDMYILV